MSKDKAPDLVAVGLQFIMYLVVGGLSACVDVGGFWILVGWGAPIMITSVVSFVAATAVNYFLCCLLAFVRGRFTLGEELVRFLIVSFIGLAINTLIVWLSVRYVGGQPVIGKIVALPIVLAWNFVGRWLFVFRKDAVSAPVSLARHLLRGDRGVPTTDVTYLSTNLGLAASKSEDDINV